MEISSTHQASSCVTNDVAQTKYWNWPSSWNRALLNKDLRDLIVSFASGAEMQ